MIKFFLSGALVVLFGIGSAVADAPFNPVAKAGVSIRPTAVTQPCGPGQEQIWCVTKICVKKGETCCTSGTLRFVCPVDAPCDQQARPPTCRPRSG